MKTRHFTIGNYFGVTQKPNFEWLRPYISDPAKEMLKIIRALWQVDGVFALQSRNYESVFPSQRHKMVGKETGLTNYIERFNCTLRQRIGRLVRKALDEFIYITTFIGLPCII